MRYFGLIGFPLTHSFSEKYFAKKFLREGITECRYNNFPIQSVGLLDALVAGNRELVGLNVTIPYKEQIIAFLDELDREAMEIGAVNTIRISRKGNNIRLKGFNTDAYGFKKSIEPYLKDHFSHAVILGTGGASRAVSYVLKKMGLHITFVSRTAGDQNRISYAQCTEEYISRADIIVNTSPVGMVPHTGQYPEIPYDFVRPGQILYDLIYNPPETAFLAHGKNKGATIINGLQMLHLQADKSWEIWNNSD
jgi:shikimate dehydrogenase